MAPRTVHRLVGVAVGLALLTSCQLGERPTLLDETALDAATGDAAIDTVLARFATVDDATFTASYRITNNFGPVVRDATVAQRGPERSITVGDVRFLLGPSSARTCRDLDDPTATCVDGADDSAISDLQVTHQFYGRSTAARLRTDARRRIGPTEGYQADLADQVAQCVNVPVSGGTKVYCALDDGVLASYQGPDVLIELTAYEPAVTDDSLFTP